MTYASEVLADSPGMYFRLGESSGTTMTDSSGNGRNGSYSATVALGRPGLVGDGDTAAGFDSDSYSTMATAASGGLAATTAVTIEFWVKTTSTTSATIICREDTSAASRIWRVGQGTFGQVYLQNPANNSTILSNAYINNGAKHHVAIVVNGTAVSIYIDGVLDVAGTMSGNLRTTPASTIRLGTDTTGFYFYGGTLDEVAIYPTALSNTRIAAHYTVGNPYVPPIDVDALLGSSGSGLTTINASVAPKPPNDDYLDAVEVVLTEGEYLSEPPTFTSADYTMQSGEDFAEGNGANTAWWKFTPSADMNVQIDTLQSTSSETYADTEMSIYTLDEGTLTYVTGDSDTGGDHGGADYTSWLQTELTGGVTYYIQVGDYNNADPPISYRLHVQQLDGGTDPGPGEGGISGDVTVAVACSGVGFTSIDGDIPHLRLYIPDRVINRGPASVSVILTEAIPLVDVTFRFDGTVLAVEPADSQGEIIALTLTADETLASAGTHRITATQPGTVGSSASVTFTNDPFREPLSVIPDLDAIEIPGAVVHGVRHWVLQDLAPDGLGSWVMPVSPATWTPPHVQRTLQAVHTTARSGQFHVWESSVREATAFTFKGYCPTQEMLDRLVAYSELNRRFYLIDHRNRAWRVAFTHLDAVPRLRQIGLDRVPTDWGHDYTVTAVAYGQNWKVPQ